MIKRDKQKFVLISVFFVLCLVVASSGFLLAVSADEYNITRITITNLGNEMSSAGPELTYELESISEGVVNEIAEMDAIREVVPVIASSFGFDMGDERPSMNGTFPPDIGDDFEGQPFEGQPPGDQPFEGQPPGDTDMQMPDFEGMGGRGSFGYSIEGIDLLMIDEYECYTLPSEVTSGRSLVSDDSLVVFVGSEVLEYFNSSVGEEIGIEGVNFTIVGTFSDGEYSKYIFMNITDARALFEYGSSEFNTVYAYVEDESDVDSVSSTLQEEYPDYLIMGQGDYSDRPPMDMEFDVHTNPDSTETPAEGEDAATPGFELPVAIFTLCLICISKRIFGGKTRDE